MTAASTSDHSAADAAERFADRPLEIVYFSDVLCIWAYVAQLRIKEAKAQYGARIAFRLQFCNVFGDTARKIRTSWGADGYERFNAHIREAASRFPTLSVHPDIWALTRPASSLNAHVVLKAAQLSGVKADGLDSLAMEIRAAFFGRALDISNSDVLRRICEEAGLDIPALDAQIRIGHAQAAIMSDYQEATDLKISGSPTYILNEGRQKLFGNVGYRVLAANIDELLRHAPADEASWC